MTKKTTSPTEPTDRDRSKDTGMALVLVCLLVSLYRQDQRFLLPAVILLIVTMAWPGIFYYPSKAWFGFARIMGNVVSRILLVVLFFAVVTPVGLVRRLFNADPMKRKLWKNGTASVFTVRDHLYTGQDMKQPY